MSFDACRIGELLSRCPRVDGLIASPGCVDLVGVIILSDLVDNLMDAALSFEIEFLGSQWLSHFLGHIDRRELLA